jgi:hypothetical protein
MHACFIKGQNFSLLAILCNLLSIKHFVLDSADKTEIPFSELPKRPLTTNNSRRSWNMTFFFPKSNLFFRDTAQSCGFSNAVGFVLHISHNLIPPWFFSWGNKAPYPNDFLYP